MVCPLSSISDSLDSVAPLVSTLAEPVREKVERPSTVKVKVKEAEPAPPVNVSFKGSPDRVAADTVEAEELKESELAMDVSVVLCCEPPLALRPSFAALVSRF